MYIQSPAFVHSEIFPKKFTGLAQNAAVSPPLTWGDVPQNVQSFSVFCVSLPQTQKAEMCCAPFSTVHWLMFNIPPHVREIPQNFLPDALDIKGWGFGFTGGNGCGYNAPMPANGAEVTRVYFFLYALHQRIMLKNGVHYSALFTAVEQHKIAVAHSYACLFSAPQGILP